MDFFQRKTSFTSRVYSSLEIDTELFANLFRRTVDVRLAQLFLQRNRRILKIGLRPRRLISQTARAKPDRDDFSSSVTERSNDKERWFVRRKADKFAADPIIDSSATAIRFHLASGCPSRTLIQQLYKRRVKRSPAAIDAFFFLSICSLIFNHSLLQIAISSFEARTNV